MTALTSTRSVFQTMLRSFSPTSPKDSTMSSIFLQPSSNVSYAASALSTTCKWSAVSSPGHSQGYHASIQSLLSTNVSGACNGSTVILIDSSIRELFLAMQTGMARSAEGTADCCHYLRPEDSSICLHGLLQLAADLRHAQAALGVAQLVQALYGVGARVCRQVRLGSSRLALLSCSPHTHVRPHHVQILGVALHKLILPTKG